MNAHNLPYGIPSVTFLENERLPDSFMVKFEEIYTAGRPTVRISIDDVPFGNCLTDNAYQEDGYRYHDIFHFAYAAILGWSPCVRTLLKRKRKSSPMIDEVEDGGRATVVEEAISLLAYSYAKEADFFRNADVIKPDLINAIRRLTAGLEISDCPTDHWKQAILVGYHVFNRLYENKGGRVRVDIKNKMLIYESNAESC